jgi:hypothetical protein
MYPGGDLVDTGLGLSPQVGEARPRHPVRGPFLPYDPTNGTVSTGDILKVR